MWRTSNTYRVVLPSGEELVFGPDTGWPGWCAHIDKITSSVDVRAIHADRSQADGAVAGDTFLGSRSVVFDLKLIENDITLRGAQIAAIGRATQAYRADCSIQWQEDDGTEREVIGRLVTYPALGHDSDSHVKSMQLGFLCEDPTIRSQALWQRERVAGDEMLITNAGDAPSRPKIFLYGPSSNYYITWGGVETRIELGDTLDAEDYIEVDCYERTVRLNGGRNRSGTLVEGYDDFPVLPANSTTAFNLIATTVPGLDPPTWRIDWRHRWMV